MDDPMDGEYCRSTESRIFEGYRSLGNVSNHIPCLVRHIHRRKENFVTTCTGKSFATYTGNGLKLLSISSNLKENIECISADTYHVYTGAGENIYAWRRGTEIKHKYVGHEKKVIHMLPFAENLISVDESSLMILWDIKSEEIVWKQQFNNSDTIVTGLMHPASYMNKILITSEQGHLMLWNIRSNKMIHRFEGWKSAVTFVAQAPVLDVVAIGLANQEVVLHNLLGDLTLFKLKCNDVPISLAFRTDGQHILLVGGRAGTITMWDLEKKEVIVYADNAHERPVTGLQCFPQEPLFVSSSEDNSVKVWIFDMPDGSFRLLNSRDGHKDVPKKIRFHGPFNILSSGEDCTFRLFHIHNETYNRCLSKKNVHKNKLKGSRKLTDGGMSAIVDFTCGSIANPKHYDDVACCHVGKSSITTWSIHDTHQNVKTLDLPKNKVGPIESEADVFAWCLCITSCGQFVIVGYSNGRVEKFNIQSHRHRQSYERHRGATTGLAVCNYNTKILTGGVDQILRISNFKTGENIIEHDLDSGVAFIYSSCKTNLIGVSLQNFEIKVVDMTSANVVRTLSNMSDVILDAKFSPNSSWLTASTNDCLIRTWDMYTANMIDAFRTETIVLSLDYSPDGQYLATVLSDSLGIVLWINKTVYSHVSLLPLPLDYQPQLMETNSVGYCDAELDDICLQDDVYESLEQISSQSITFALKSGSKWKSLLSFDIINARQAKEVKPQTYVAPFFIDNIMSSANQNNAIRESTTEKVDENKVQSKVVKFDISKSKFGTLLMKEGKEAGDYEKMLDMLANESQPNIVFEIQALEPDIGGSTVALNHFMNFLTEASKTRKYSETIQSLLGLFLKIHHRDLLLRDECHDNIKLLFNINSEVFFSTTEKIRTCQILSDLIQL